MKRTVIACLALAALVALPTPYWAQTKTDFSGSWSFDASKSDAAAAAGRRGGGGGRMGGGGTAAAMTVTQSATHITIDRTMGQGQTSAVYKLDSSESTNLIGDVFLSRSRVSWDGPKLVITTRKDLGLTPTGPMTEELKEVFSLEGGVLTVVTSTRVPPAGEQTRRLVYNKKAS
jgi:hypothetical protein